MCMPVYQETCSVHWNRGSMEKKQLREGPATMAEEMRRFVSVIG